MKIKTIWEYSLETEATRLLHCAHQIAVGFYRVNNFIVHPYVPKIKNPLIVTFPDLSYTQIPRFWDQARKIEIENFPLQVKPDLLKQTMNLLKEANLPLPDFQKTKSLWLKAQNEILGEIYKIIPAKKDQIKEIIIYPTSFGTSSSFNLFGNNAKGKVRMYLREDQRISAIIEAILTSLTRPGIYEKLGGIWQESEIITDWLISESSLARVIKKYEKKSNFVPTIKGTRIKQQAKLLQESEEFSQKLGLPVNQNVFGLNGLTPEIYQKPVGNLSLMEKSILRLLIQKANNVATFDEIADTLFPSEEHFSLYAIAKTIQRLRNKLEANGISGCYIQTLRGRGYLLKN